MTSGFWHRLRDTITHWFVGGVILLVTGLVPEEWLAHLVEKLHVSTAALHLWSVGLDVRVALALFGVALIVGDIYLRRRPRPAAGAASGTTAPVAPTAIAASSVGTAVPPGAMVDAAHLLPNKPSVAVMPFANLSGDPEQDYFADGMVVEIVEALSRIRSIFVIGSGSTLSLKDKALGPREVGRQFGVR